MIGVVCVVAVDLLVHIVMQLFLVVVAVAVVLLQQLL